MADLSYNCTCDDTFASKTRLELRLKLMRKLGFSAQASNPPPGMAALLNDFLEEAQEMLYWEVDDFRCSRFFSWDLEADVSLYDLAENADDCTRPWDPTKIEWVGIAQDEANIWPLYAGIDPTLRGSPSVGGYPSRYDIRQCIELWPTPSAANTNAKLIVKGEFGLGAFADDDDTTTLDWMLVYLRALANAASHYNKQLVAKNAVEQGRLRLMKLTAASHLPGARYIPRTRIRCDGDHLSGISGPRGIRFAQDGGVRFDQTEA